MIRIRLLARRRSAFVIWISAVMLALTLFAEQAANAADPSFSEAQKRQLNSLIERYIMDNPEVILQSIQRMQARQKAEEEAQAVAALKTHKQELEADPDAPIMGNPNGKITVVEFFDYRCGYCKRVFPTVMKVLNDNPNVRYLVKEFPILGPESVLASRASLAVWRTHKEKYGAFHAALMDVRGGIPEAKILGIAGAMGIDPGKLKVAMADPEIERILEKNYKLAQALNINGTPAFVIGGKLAPGAIDAATMQRMISEAGG